MFGADEREGASIARIYNEGSADCQATLETQLRTPDERREWVNVLLMKMLLA